MKEADVDKKSRPPLGEGGGWRVQTHAIKGRRIKRIIIGMPYRDKRIHI